MRGGGGEESQNELPRLRPAVAALLLHLGAPIERLRSSVFSGIRQAEDEQSYGGVSDAILRYKRYHNAGCGSGQIC